MGQMALRSMGLSVPIPACAVRFKFRIRLLVIIRFYSFKHVVQVARLVCPNALGVGARSGGLGYFQVPAISVQESGISSRFWLERCLGQGPSEKHFLSAKAKLLAVLLCPKFAGGRGPWKAIWLSARRAAHWLASLL